jgi:hypothetical protein
MINPSLSPISKICFAIKNGAAKAAPSLGRKTCVIYIRLINDLG